MSLAVTPREGCHLSQTSTGSHIFALCLPRLPQQIYILPPDASVLLQSESGPGTGMRLKPLAWMSWRLLHTQHSRMYNVTCLSNRFLMSLPSLPGLFPHSNTHTRDARSTGTRGSFSLLGCSPSVLWTLPCFAHVQLFSATF